LRSVQDYRADDRQRQQDRRDRRTDGDRHAPPSAPKYAEIKAKVLDFWDRAAAASRASLTRHLPGIVRAISRSDGTDQAPGGAPSRASFPSQVVEKAGD